MSIAQSFLAEFEQELNATRKFLENIPADQLQWRPHEKSLTAGQLGLHLAASMGQVAQMAQRDECSPPDFGEGVVQPDSAQDMLDALEESAASVRAILPGISDEQMQQTWRLVNDGQEILAMPRAAVFRAIMLNHTYHHRGQLGVYLRLLGAQVPSAYGPSADEQPDFVKNM